MKKHTYFKVVPGLLLAAFVWSCSNDDGNNDQELQAWEMEVEQLKSVTSQYMDFDVAENEGRIDVSGYVPNMGHHYLNPALADGIFELDKPEIILYVPDENGRMQMVAVEYSIVPEDPENPGNPPEGFTGNEDIWHFNEMVGQWQLHVWTILENPDGLFAPFNPAIGD
ncbi:MAG: hypothetical protein AB3N14_02025 [Flavobacteriaceae bacterium]